MTDILGIPPVQGPRGESSDSDSPTAQDSFHDQGQDQRQAPNIISRYLDDLHDTATCATGQGPIASKRASATSHQTQPGTSNIHNRAARLHDAPDDEDWRELAPLVDDEWHA